MRSFVDDSRGLYLGHNEVEKPAFLPCVARTMHTQIIGATGVGKTESGILPLLFNDVRKGHSVIFIDPKTDSSTLSILKTLCNVLDRSKDFIHIDLNNAEGSCGYNPLKIGIPSELKDKIVGSAIWTEEFYKKISERALLSAFLILKESNLPITMSLLGEYLRTPERVANIILQKNPDLADDCMRFQEMLSANHRNLEGVRTDLELWTQSEIGRVLMNPEADSVLDWIMNQKIVYISLNTLAYEDTARRFGRLIIQDLKTAVQRLQSMSVQTRPTTSVFIDEFASVASSGFIELLNKARSANVQLTLAHQSLGDLTSVSHSFANQILDNTNVKMIFRLDSPDASDYFARLVGTKKSEKKTAQIASNGILGSSQTGLGTTRDTDEFIVSPNQFRTLGRGEAFVISKIPYAVARCGLKRISDWIKVSETNESKREDYVVKHIHLTLCLSACAGLISGCSTFGKSTGAGAGVGALAGGIAGSFIPGDESSKPRNVIVGAAAGATLGALSGALIHKTMEDRERDAFEKGKSSTSKSSNRGTVVASGNGSGNRRYVPPKIERRWVEDEIRGNVMVEAHYEQVIVEEGHWE